MCVCVCVCVCLCVRFYALPLEGTIRNNCTVFHGDECINAKGGIISNGCCKERSYMYSVNIWGKGECFSPNDQVPLPISVHTTDVHTLYVCMCCLCVA